jgi:hypothetical protein
MKEIPVLVAKGPLFVGPAWDAELEKPLHPSLFFIYMKRFMGRIGPFYANMALAERDMRKILKEFPQQSFWEQSLDWYRRQGSLHQWVDKNLGRPGDLIGGQWAPEEVTP